MGKHRFAFLKEEGRIPLQANILITHIKYAMENDQPTIPLTSYFFIFLLICGTIILIASFFIMRLEPLFAGLRQIGAGLLLIGIGEWVNHPLQKSLSLEGQENLIFKKFKHRKRNPSGLGNILEISGLLLLFMGIAYYI